LQVVQDRAVSLQPLMKWKSTWCRVEARLTQPAIARYQTMFPDQQVGEILSYTWKAQKFNCEVTPLEATPVSKNHQGFVETAMCTLLQTHWVNSPFEDLQVHPQDVTKDKDGRVHLQSSMIDKELGIYLDPGPFKLETRTKARGILRAEYAENAAHKWLPTRLEQVTPKSRLVVDSIEYDSALLNGRHLIKSLWISVGDQEEVRQHTQLNFYDCQGF
jgi:hypothetical protein